MDNFGSPMAGAVCPRHPLLEAISTCGRCGTFMCRSCSEGGSQTLCPDCRERSGMQEFPLTRDTWNFGALWDYCWESFKREWVMLSLGALCLMVLTFIVQAVAGILPLMGAATDSPVLTGVLQVIATFIQTAVQGVLGLGFLRMAYDVLQGQRADVGRLFSQVHKAGTYIVALLLIFLMVGIPLAALAGVGAGVVVALGGFENEAVVAGVFGGLVLLALPFLIYYTIPLYLLQPALAWEEQPGSATDLIRHCYTVARGERMSLFGVMLVSGLVVLAGLIACCVGVIPASGLAQLLMAGVYLALRNEGDGGAGRF